MNRIITASVLALSVAGLASAPALAAFTLSNDSGGDGYVVTFPGGFDLFSSDNALPAGGNNTIFVNVATSTRSITYNYIYTSGDCCGSYWDPAGAYFNGALTQLSIDQYAPSGPIAGSYTFHVTAGDTYGFYAYSVDSLAGRADISVTSNVPEPAAWAMMLVGFGLVGGAVRRRNGKPLYT